MDHFVLFTCEAKTTQTTAHDHNYVARNVAHNSIVIQILLKHYSHS